MRSTNVNTSRWPLIVLGNEALEMARETGDPQMPFPCYDRFARLNLEVGNMAEAERYFAPA